MPSPFDPKSLNNIASYHKAMTAANNVLSSFNKNIQDISSAVSGHHDNLKKLTKQQKVLNAALKATSLVKEGGKNWIEASKALSSLTDGEKELAQAIAKRASQSKSAQRSLSRANKAIKDQIQGVSQEINSMVDSSVSAYNRMEESAKQAAQGSYQEFRDNYEKISKMIEDTADPKLRAMPGYEEKLQAATLGKMGGGYAGPLKQITAARTGAAGKSELAGELGAQLKNIFSGFKTGNVKQVSQARESLLKYMKVAGATSGATSKLASTVSLFGTALKGLGKLSIIMAVIGAVGKLVTVMSDLDKFLKGLNRKFVELAGPMQDIGDAAGAMKEYNLAIHDISRNIRMGLKAEDIQRLFGAMAASGMSLQGVIARIGDYSTAIESARKTSLAFGVSLEEMGTMVSDQMLELRIGLSEVEDSFVQISGSAERAGISSTKFYQAVEQSALQLGFYGNFLESASKQLANFIETGRLGLGDSIKQTQELTSTLEKLGTVDKMKVIQLVGEDEIRKMFNQAYKNFESKRVSLEEEILSMRKDFNETEDLEEKKRLSREIEAREKELRAVQAMSDEARDAMSGTLDQMASKLPMLSDRLGQMIAKIFGKGGPFSGVFEEGGLAYQKIMGDVFKMSEEQAIKFHANAKAGANQILRAAESLQEATRDEKTGKLFDVPDDTKKLLKQKLDALDLAISSGEDVVGAVEHLTGAVGEWLKHTDKTGEEIAGITSDFERVAKMYPDLVGKMFDAQGIDITEALEAVFARDLLKQQEEAAKMQKNELDTLIDRVTPLADYVGIGAEGLKLAAAYMSDEIAPQALLMNIAKNVGDIANKIVKGQRVKEEAARRKLIDEGVADEFKDLIKKERLLALEERDEEAREVRKRITKQRKTAFKGSNLQDFATGLEVQAREELRVQQQNLENLREQARTRGENVILTKEITAEERKLRELMDKPLGIDYEVATQALNEAAAKRIKDGRLSSTGLFFGARGDIVVDRDSMAKTLSAATGGMTQHALSMGKNALSTMASPIRSDVGTTFNAGGIHLNFNAPTEGSPSEYQRLFVRAVEQIVDQKMYKSKMRV